MFIAKVILFVFVFFVFFLTSSSTGHQHTAPGRFRAMFIEAALQQVVTLMHCLTTCQALQRFIHEEAAEHRAESQPWTLTQTQVNYFLCDSKQAI